MTNLERKFLIFCCKRDKEGHELEPWIVDLLHRMLDKRGFIIVKMDDEMYEFRKRHDNLYILHRWENNRFVYQSKLRIKKCLTS